MVGSSGPRLRAAETPRERFRVRHDDCPSLRRRSRARDWRVRSPAESGERVNAHPVQPHLRYIFNTPGGSVSLSTMQFGKSPCGKGVEARNGPLTSFFGAFPLESAARVMQTMPDEQEQPYVALSENVSNRLAYEPSWGIPWDGLKSKLTNKTNNYPLLSEELADYIIDKLVESSDWPVDVDEYDMVYYDYESDAHQHENGEQGDYIVEQAEENEDGQGIALRDLKAYIGLVEENHEDGAPEAQIIADTDYPQEEVEEAIEQLKQSGSVYEPKTDHLRVT